MSDVQIENYQGDGERRAGLRISSGFARIGPRPDCENIIRIVGLRIADPANAQIFFQPRAMENTEAPEFANFKDMWTIRTIAVEPDHVTIRIRRIDSPHGWALILRLDVLIVES